MIDGTNRDWSSRFWQALAMPLVKAGLSPNQVTWTGLVLVLANAAAYLAHEQSFWFGLGLIFSFAFDALDGAVARLTGKTSKYGGYLDAVIDRYQEIAAYMAIGLVTGWWALCFLALSGSLMVSYNKARTALEIPIQNHNWPDLMERFERIFVLCAALILDAFVPVPDFLGGRALYVGIALIAALSHLTAVQRFLRARALLRGE
jgi:CDP-diacylglycerol--glycerol-3-phosphate 3-phosphatidyltransferase/archaetidylinositol phosphate synthase